MEDKRYKNDELNNKAGNAKCYQDAISIIKVYETILQRQIRNILMCPTYRQGCAFNKFKD